MSETTLRIAPRSAVAIADLHLLRVARTEPRPADAGRLSIADRLRRLAPGVIRRS